MGERKVIWSLGRPTVHVLSARTWYRTWCYKERTYSELANKAWIELSSWHCCWKEFSELVGGWRVRLLLISTAGFLSYTYNTFGPQIIVMLPWSCFERTQVVDNSKNIVGCLIFTSQIQASGHFLDFFFSSVVLCSIFFFCPQSSSSYLKKSRFSFSSSLLFVSYFCSFFSLFCVLITFSSLYSSFSSVLFFVHYFIFLILSVNNPHLVGFWKVGLFSLPFYFHLIFVHYSLNYK